MRKKTINVHSPDDATEFYAMIDAAAAHPAPATSAGRTVFGIFPSSLMPTKRNPSAANRASAILLCYALSCWIISLMLTAGSIFAFYHLERFELFTTSHDARIEQISGIQQVEANED